MMFQKIERSRNEINRAIALALLLARIDEMEKNGKPMPRVRFTNTGDNNDLRVLRAVEIYNTAGRPS